MKLSDKILHKLFGNFQISGTEIKTDCPNPGCRKPRGHFYFNILTNQSWCHICGYSPSIYELLHKKKIVDYSNNITEFTKLKSPTATLPEDFKLITKDDIGYRYLRGRNITDEQIKKYEIGVAPSTYKNFIIIPIKNAGILELFIIHEKGYNLTPWNNWSIKKGNVLFNLDEASQYRTAIIMEAAFDVLSTQMNNGIALLTSYITDHQVMRLAKIFQNFLVWLDPDTWEKIAGNKECTKIEKVANKLRSYGKIVYVVDNATDKKDPSDIGKLATQYLKYKMEKGKIIKWK